MSNSFPSTAPVLPEGLSLARPLLWRQAGRQPAAEVLAASEIGAEEPLAARARWQRFAPLLARLFPGDVAADGRIDSQVRWLG